MKTIITFLLFFVSILIFAQSKKFEATNATTGKSIVIENAQRVKLITLTKEKLIGDLIIIDLENVSVNGINVKLDNIASIKNYPVKGKKLKKIVFGTGLGLVAGSAVAAAFGNGSAFSLFAVGAATTIVGGLLDNKNKTFLKNRCIFKIIDK